MAINITLPNPFEGGDSKNSVKKREERRRKLIEAGRESFGAFTSSVGKFFSGIGNRLSGDVAEVKRRQEQSAKVVPATQGVDLSPQGVYKNTLALLRGDQPELRSVNGRGEVVPVYTPVPQSFISDMSVQGQTNGVINTKVSEPPSVAVREGNSQPGQQAKLNNLQEQINQFQVSLKSLIENDKVDLTDTSSLREKIGEAEAGLAEAQAKKAEVMGELEARTTPQTAQEIFDEYSEIRKLVGVGDIENKYNELYSRIVSIPSEVEDEFSRGKSGTTFPQHLIESETAKRLKNVTPLFQAVADQLARKEAMIKTVQDGLKTSRDNAEQQLNSYIGFLQGDMDAAEAQLASQFKQYEDIRADLQKQVENNLKMSLDYPNAGIAPTDSLIVAYTKALPFAQQEKSVEMEKKLLEYSSSQINLAKDKRDLEGLLADIDPDSVMGKLTDNIVYDGVRLTNIDNTFSSSRDRDTAYKLVANKYLEALYKDPSLLFNGRFGRQAVTSGGDVNPEDVANSVLNDSIVRSIYSPEELVLLKNSADRWQASKEEGLRAEAGSGFWNSLFGIFGKGSPSQEDVIIVNK